MNALYLAFAYLRYHWGRSLILTLVAALIIFVPIATQILLSSSERALVARGEATPLLLGSRGSQLDLTMAALYFSDERPDPVTMAEVEAVWDSGLGIPIPLHTAFSSSGFRIVGPSLDYFDFRDLIVADGRGLSLLGDAVIGADVAAALGKAGITPDDTVVLYSDTPYRAARVWWTLHNYGHRKIRVLDGGIMGWHRYAFPTTILWPFHRETDYPVPERRQPLVADLRETFRALDDECAAVIDVRDREEYVGDVVHVGTEEKGRIAGSTHIHWSAFLDDLEKLKSTPEIIAVLEDHGIRPNQRIITYCHIGLRSSHTVMALYAAGFPPQRIANYDGSWMEWSTNPSLPVAGGEREEGR